DTPRMMPSIVSKERNLCAQISLKPMESALNRFMQSGECGVQSGECGVQSAEGSRRPGWLYPAFADDLILPTSHRRVARPCHLEFRCGVVSRPRSRDHASRARWCVLPGSACGTVPEWLRRYGNQGCPWVRPQK